MARAQLVPSPDPYKFKQGDWVRARDPVSDRWNVGVVHSRSTEETGEDTIYWVALKQLGGFSVPRTFMQKDLGATDAPRATD